MSSSYDSYIGIGFVVDQEDVLDIFKRKRQEKSHLEDRYDVKTGKKLKPERIIDVEAGLELAIGDDVFEYDLEGYDQDFLDSLGDFFDCTCCFLWINMEDGEHSSEILFQPVMPADFFDDSESIEFHRLPELEENLTDLAGRLAKRGIAHGAAKVTTTWNYG